MPEMVEAYVTVVFRFTQVFDAEDFPSKEEALEWLEESIRENDTSFYDADSYDITDIRFATETDAHWVNAHWVKDSV